MIGGERKAVPIHKKIITCLNAMTALTSEDLKTLEGVMVRRGEFSGYCRALTGATIPCDFNIIIGLVEAVAKRLGIDGTRSSWVPETIKWIEAEQTRHLRLTNPEKAMIPDGDGPGSAG